MTGAGGVVRSMTGFGRGEASDAFVRIEVELKTVNQRFLDVNLRLPREHGPLEARVQAALKARLERGRVDVHVRRTPRSSGFVVRPDPQLYGAWLDAARSLVGPGAALDEARLQAWALERPGVLELVPQEVVDQDEATTLDVALTDALDALVAMREAEGLQLAKVLTEDVLAIEVEVDAIALAVADLDARLRERLLARMHKLLGEAVEPWRIAQEAALLAEKADVAEELARLRSHIGQVRGALEAGSPVGRRLEFLLVEMNREVNTLGAKTVDHPVSHRVVELKTLLERLREQAANVE